MFKSKYLYIIKHKSKSDFFPHSGICLYACLYVSLLVYSKASIKIRFFQFRCLSVCISECQYVSVSVCIYQCLYISVSVCISVCMYQCLYVSVSVCVCVCFLVVYNKAQAQRISNREFKLWTFLQGTESRMATFLAEICVISHQSLSRPAKSKC